MPKTFKYAKFIFLWALWFFFEWKKWVCFSVVLKRSGYTNFTWPDFISESRALLSKQKPKRPRSYLWAFLLRCSFPTSIISHRQIIVFTWAATPLEKKTWHRDSGPVSARTHGSQALIDPCCWDFFFLFCLRQQTICILHVARLRPLFACGLCKYNTRGEEIFRNENSQGLFSTACIRMEVRGGCLVVNTIQVSL